MQILKTMKKIVLVGLFFLAVVNNVLAQANEYRAFAEKQNDVIHTKLVAGFDYTKSQLNGEVWLQLKPHFYATNQLVLDAKGMDIHTVAIEKNNAKKKLSYSYDSLQLTIQLDKSYTKKEQYTIYIKYTAKPNEYKAGGSAAITYAKGLYFINPLGTEKNKPTQIWTQGETEGTSVWIPIIDKPNQKTTQEFHLTVPSKYVSLSNGLLIKQVDNKNGTRLDVWKMNQPHSPYLFFIGVGDYAIVKDTYNGKEVSYYIEKEYEKVARKIYGNTPAMIAFYEKILGVNFPWVKYAQMSARDYVSGAMENTTATLHSDAVQQDARELVDENAWESTIAHELFHQWFGDLVTAESWSNLTVNESFADYSQTLWAEHSKGKDEGQYENYKGLRAYLSSPTDAEKDLVRFSYKDREDMFDLVSYQKGGRILNMLRHFVGDEAFFASLNKYLVDNQFKNGSAIKLKLAFEAVTGKDLNWFFNQWYFGKGHPYVRITQQYDASKKQVMVKLQQTQVQEKIFTLPIGIDVYVQGNKKHYDVWMKNKVDSFYFDAAQAPENVNVDNDKILLWAKDESKPIEQYAYQFKHAANFLDRFEAVKEAAENQNNPIAQGILKAAFKDSFYVIRAVAMSAYNPKTIDSETEATLFLMAGNDKNNSNREAAIDFIGALEKANYKPYFIDWTKDSSYAVAGAALEALEKLDSTMAKAIAYKESKNITKKRLNTAVSNIITKYGDESVFDYVAEKYEALNIQSSEKFYMTTSFAQLLNKTSDPIKFKKGIDLIVAFREAIPQGYRTQTDPYFNGKIFSAILKGKKDRGEQALVDIVTAVLPKL